MPQIFIGHFEVARETGFRCVSIELHCGDVLWTNFDPVNFCPFDTSFEKHTRANKLKIEIEVVGQPIQTLRRLESAASYQIALKYLLCG